MIIWIDERSVLGVGKRSFKAGDKIPADMISQSRIDYLVSQKKIKIVDDSEKPIEKKPEKKVEPVTSKKSDKKKSFFDESENPE